ncbi:MAG: ABC transporter permease [Verrucomicrobia subdivision 3 bacterium]|nr:ABC transporter permease [Limisphaerales bacterium]
MNKMLLIASNEFSAFVRSKAFIISVLFAPAIMGVSVLIQKAANDHVDTTERKFAIIDSSGQLANPLITAAHARNDALAATTDRQALGGPFTPELAQGHPLPELRLKLSERIRSGNLFAFIEIPANILQTNATPDAVRYFSDEPTYRDLPRWLKQTLTAEVRDRRFASARISHAARQLFRQLDVSVNIEPMGLVELHSQSGQIEDAQKVDKIRAFIVPIALMVLMYVIVLTSTPNILNSVLEEKMSRISEVLLGSVSPTHLMLGKLIGCLWIAAILAFLYLGSALTAAHYHGYGDAVPPALLAWFAAYLLLAIFFFGSLFIAIGAACTDIKSAQAAMMPVMMLVIMPLMAFPIILKNPNGNLAVGLSLFPPATPLIMTLRIALQPGPPLWQPILALVLTCGTTLGIVWAAGKVFRTGILMQGKSASLREMLRWVLAK